MLTNRLKKMSLSLCDNQNSGNTKSLSNIFSNNTISNCSKNVNNNGWSIGLSIKCGIEDKKNNQRVKVEHRLMIKTL